MERYNGYVNVGGGFIKYCCRRSQRQQKWGKLHKPYGNGACTMINLAQCARHVRRYLMENTHGICELWYIQVARKQRITFQ